MADECKCPWCENGVLSNVLIPGEYDTLYAIQEAGHCKITCNRCGLEINVDTEDRRKAIKPIILLNSYNGLFTKIDELLSS